MDIDESRQYEAPSLFGRFRDAIFSAVLAALLFQVALFFGLRVFFDVPTIFLLYDNPIFLAVIGIAAILGFWIGRPFYDHLNHLLNEWFVIVR